MDQFGVLVESIGFKSQNKSTPLADLKGKTNINNGFPPNLDFKTKAPSNSVDGSGFGSNDGLKTQNSNGFDDVFGGSTVYDLETVFKGFNDLGAKSDFVDNGDDIFGVFTGTKDSDIKNFDNVFGKIPPPPKRNDFNDDLLGGFSDMKSKPNGVNYHSVNVSKNDSGFDDLIPGFGEISDLRKGEKSERSSPWQSSDQDGKSKFFLVEDPFNIFEASPSLVPNPPKQGDRRASEDVDVLESFFGMGNRTKNELSPSSVSKDSVYDTLFQKRKVPANQGFENSFTTRKVSPVINVDDDFSFLSEVEFAPTSGKFQEVEGESEERRRARLNHHQNTQERMIKALNEKNQRDRQVQLEQEERHRLAATLDADIKRWAAGKEGNLRALLSSLQYVLWPECGWRPVSLTDMMTSISVKKVYQKATLCVHPDKVQQKGASIQQKYIAEKVFDVLKEAYNKFSSEEL